MFLKKILPIVLLACLIAGGIFQPGFAVLGSNPGNNGIQRPQDDLYVCSSGCPYSSIQAAINDANPNDNIHLADETFTERITVNQDLTILGEGPAATIIEADPTSQTAPSRVITVTQGVSVTIQGLTVRHGVAYGSGIDGQGGGILNQGSLTLEDTRIYNNFSYLGGGLANISSSTQAAVMIRDTTIDDNTATRGIGGGIYNSAPADQTSSVTLINSTLNGNQAEISGDNHAGGGIANIAEQGNAILTIQNSTLSDNFLDGGGGGYGIHSEAISGSASANITQATIYSNGAYNLYVVNSNATVTQSILADATASGSDCYTDNGYVNNGGFNLVEDGSCGFPVGGDPLLDPRADNGGNTQTHALKVNSPAIDAIPPLECSSPSDQRGVDRPFGVGCDIGAFELNQLELNLEQYINQSNDVINVKPGELLTITVKVNPQGTGVSNGMISADMPEVLNIMGSISLDPPDAGIIGTGPPTLAHSLIISSSHMVTVTMFAEVDLGLPIGNTYTNTISFTSTEVITPVVTAVILNIENAPPIAVDDSGVGFITNFDQVFTTTNVLDNDYDPNGDEFYVHPLVDVTNLEGELTNHEDGTFTYDPNGKFDNLPPGTTAYDTFIYTILDGHGGFDSATVTISIQNSANSIYLPFVSTSQ